MNNLGESHSWMTYVEIPDLGSHDAKQTFTVSFGDSEGIISTNGSCCIYPFQFHFTVDWSYTGSECTERNVGAEIVDWKDENFNSDTLPHDLSAILISLDQLRISKDNEATFSKWHLDTLSNEIDLFRDLSSDGSCKIANLTLARLLIAKDMVSHGFPLMGKRIHSQEVLDLFDGLMKMDPPHSQYYKDEHSLVLMDQITSEKEELRKRCSHYRTPSSSSHAQYVCLRLNRLSLSRIGFFERLLWVQMLDLSHNEVRSIEGLEAMQLLCCLNLSNNKIRSFSALGPLRLIKSLRVLDISNNEIGAHSTDSTRYAWPSPLSHNTEEYMKDVEQTAHWEAILLFKGLILTQLDVKGNAVADESLQALLPRVLPTLKWLDRSVPTGYGSGRSCRFDEVWEAFFRLSSTARD
ncbi:hypothetical protein QJS10_CPA02g00125 [Acorus calamus]|uniref:Uncharacterized protein n=1 Tax=Acorus calamus TaxID=4465 RepID=A0AAV9FCW6_ACOCL|nr:hypothetical protein QJS10_CPA02g00125 [Acorus calamus]